MVTRKAGDPPPLPGCAARSVPRQQGFWNLLTQPRSRQRVRPSDSFCACWFENQPCTWRAGRDRERGRHCRRAGGRLGSGNLTADARLSGSLCPPTCPNHKSLQRGLNGVQPRPPSGWPQRLTLPRLRLVLGSTGGHILSMTPSKSAIWLLPALLGAAGAIGKSKRQRTVFQKQRKLLPPWRRFWGRYTCRAGSGPASQQPCAPGVFPSDAALSCPLAQCPLLLGCPSSGTESCCSFLWDLS